jgi:hypothetical protein
MENQINYSFHLDEQESESLRYQIRTSSRCQIATLNELKNLRCQIGTSSLGHGGRGYLPYVFTEQDLGKKYFAFSMMEDKSLITNFLNKL